jgi:arginine N-succinyltransferase
MTIVRAAKSSDIDQLWELIAQASFGLTTLQITKDQLFERLELSEFAFKKKTERPSGEPYVIVMEDTTTGGLCGISCIFSKVGGYEPFYHYRRVQKERTSKTLGTTATVTSLELTKIHDGPSEIGSLFLQPEYRGAGRGRLLSLSRFLFVAAHPKRFSDEFIAEMRGVVNEDGSCPFWDAIGSHFFDMGFPQADSLSTISKSFIEDLMPEHPIYEDLLSDEHRAVIAKVHPQTEPALAMLQAEGFEIRDLVDIFDGGPVVHCSRDEIGAVARATPKTLVEITDDFEGQSLIIGNLNRDFRALISDAKIEGDTVIASQVDALKLKAKKGDTLWCLPPRPVPPNA